MKDNCFTELCCFLSNLNMNRPQVYMCPLPLDPPAHLPPRPTPLGWYRAPLSELPETYSKFPLAIYFTYGNRSFHVTFSIHLTLSSPLTISTLLTLINFCLNFWEMSSFREEQLLWLALSLVILLLCFPRNEIVSYNSPI